MYLGRPWKAGPEQSICGCSTRRIATTTGRYPMIPHPFDYVRFRQDFSRGVDVTSAVRSVISAGGALYVFNNLFGDPMPCFVKA